MLKVLQAALQQYMNQELLDIQAETWNNRLVQNWEMITLRLYFVTLLVYLYAEYIMHG